MEEFEQILRIWFQKKIYIRDLRIDYKIPLDGTTLLKKGWGEVISPNKKRRKGIA